MFITKALLASTVAGLATFAMAPVHAETTSPRSMLVSYADLDLKSDAGQTKLKKRIAYAAETVCGPADTFNYQSRKATAACESDAIATANRGLVEVYADASAGGGAIRVSRK
jgi:UrcA family protein